MAGGQYALVAGLSAGSGAAGGRAALRVVGAGCCYRHAAGAVRRGGCPPPHRFVRRFSYGRFPRRRRRHFFPPRPAKASGNHERSSLWSLRGALLRRPASAGAGRLVPAGVRPKASASGLLSFHCIPQSDGHGGQPPPLYVHQHARRALCQPGGPRRGRSRHRGDGGFRCRVVHCRLAVRPVPAAVSRRPCWPPPAGLLFWWYASMVRREFGGITGDLLGFFVELSQGGLLLVLALCSLFLRAL